MIRQPRMVLVGAITAVLMGGLKQFTDYHGFGYFPEPSVIS